MRKKAGIQQEQEECYPMAEMTIQFKRGGWVRLEINANILELTSDEYWLAYRLIDLARGYLGKYPDTPQAQQSSEPDTSKELQTDETQEILMREELTAIEQGEVVSLIGYPPS